MTGVLLGLADDPIAEHDPDLTVGRFALDRFEAGLFGGLGVHPVDVILELAHQKEDPHDGEGPDDEHGEQEALVGSHIRKSRV